MASPKEENRAYSDRELPITGGISRTCWPCEKPRVSKMAPRTRTMPTLMSVVTFCRSELLRVPQTFTAVTTAITSTTTAEGCGGKSGDGRTGDNEKKGPSIEKRRQTAETIANVAV